ncbi:MAG: choice-of-anchor S family protein [Candidatus Heimdallarchaeota archaeon]
MKKLRVILLCLILLTSFVNRSFTFASFDLSDSFIYNVTDANVFVEIGENNYQKKGYVFGGLHYPDSTKVYTTIDFIEDRGIKFKFNINATNSTLFIFVGSNWIDGLGLGYSYYTLYYTYLMVEQWGNGFWLDLTLYQIRPYIDPVSSVYLSDLDAFGSDICNFFEKWSSLYPDIECEYRFTESNGIYYFESWVGGKINAHFGEKITEGVDYPTDIKFGNNMHFAVNKISGLVHGFGRRGWIKGTINNLPVKSSMSCEYVLEGFDLPDYQLGTMRYFDEVNLYLAVFLPVSIVVILVPVITYFVRKRRFDTLIKQNEVNKE